MDVPPPPAFAALRSAWIGELLAESADRRRIWSYAWAAPALTRAEAEEALAVMPEFGGAATTPALGIVPPFGNPNADKGRVYLLAGRNDEAIAALSSALGSCDLFASTRERMRAALHLGMAYEAKTDNGGACQAYGKVLAQWGNAKPQSVTASSARAKSKALGCP